MTNFWDVAILCPQFKSNCVRCRICWLINIPRILIIFQNPCRLPVEARCMNWHWKAVLWQCFELLLWLTLVFAHHRKDEEHTVLADHFLLILLAACHEYRKYKCMPNTNTRPVFWGVGGGGGDMCMVHTETINQNNANTKARPLWPYKISDFPWMSCHAFRFLSGH